MNIGGNSKNIEHEKCYVHQLNTQCEFVKRVQHSHMHKIMFWKLYSKSITEKGMKHFFQS